MLRAVFWIPWHFLRKPYLCLTDPDADPGGPRTYGSFRSRCGTKALKLFSVVYLDQDWSGSSGFGSGSVFGMWIQNLRSMKIEIVTVMPRSSDTFSTLTHFFGAKEFFFIVLKLLIYAWHLVLVVQIIKNVDLRPLVYFFFKTSLSELWVNVPKFGQYIYFALFVQILVYKPLVRTLTRFLKKSEGPRQACWCILWKKLAKILLLQATKDKIAWFYIGILLLPALTHLRLVPGLCRLLLLPGLCRLLLLPGLTRLLL